jgi:hypothetical protein
MRSPDYQPALLDRFETVTSLLLFTATNAASLRGSATSTRERDHAANLGAAIDAALVELRLIIVKVPAPIAAEPVPASV